MSGYYVYATLELNNGATYATYSTGATYPDLMIFNNYLNLDYFDISNPQQLTVGGVSQDIVQYFVFRYTGDYFISWMVQPQNGGDTGYILVSSTETQPPTSGLGYAGFSGYGAYSTSGSGTPQTNNQIVGTYIGKFVNGQTLGLYQINPNGPVAYTEPSTGPTSILAYLCIFLIPPTSPWCTVNLINTSTSTQTPGTGYPINNGTIVPWNEINSSTTSGTQDFSISTTQTSLIMNENVVTTVYLALFMTNLYGTYNNNLSFLYTTFIANATNINQYSPNYENQTMYSNMFNFSLITNNLVNNSFCSGITNYYYSNWVLLQTSNDDDGTYSDSSSVDTWNQNSIQNFQLLGASLISLIEGSENNVSLQCQNATNSSYIQNWSYNNDTVPGLGSYICLLPTSSYFFSLSNKGCQTVSPGQLFSFNNDYIYNPENFIYTNNNMIMIYDDYSPITLFIYLSVTITLNDNLINNIPTITLVVGDTSYNFSNGYYPFINNTITITGTVITKGLFYENIYLQNSTNVNLNLATCPTLGATYSEPQTPVQISLPSLPVNVCLFGMVIQDTPIDY